MTSNPQMERQFYELYLAFFHHAEKHRRWNLQEDIPWEQVNPQTDDAIADIMESFMAVEMYLPDYTAKAMQIVRRSRGRAWFQANWGYEESKHSLVIEEWLLRSGKRTYEQLRNFEEELLGKEWQPPFETPRLAIIYTMFQELATGLHYRNLRQVARDQNDPALQTLLRFVARDEDAHYGFFRQGVQLYLDADRDNTLEDLAFVLRHFAMPADSLIPDYKERSRQIIAHGVFTNRIFLEKVVKPILKTFGMTLSELRALRRVSSLHHLNPDSAQQEMTSVGNGGLRAHANCHDKR